MRKSIPIIVGGVLLFFVGKCVYMVACISCTTLPIKKYEYAGNIDEFEYKLKDFAAANPNVRIKFSRRDSSDTQNLTARDVNIQVVDKSSHTIYNLTYVETSPNETTEVDLDDVYDEIHKTGGNNTDSASVKELFNDFKNNFLPRLERGQQIVLKPEFFNF